MCAQYGRPAGVAFCFQVCRYSIEPTVPNRACNLLPKDMLRAALADEIEEGGPQVALVFLGESFPGAAERLARTRARPGWLICWPTCELQGERPSANTGEEVALRKLSQIVGANINNASFVHSSSWNKTALDELAQPRGCFWIVLIVIVHGLKTAPPTTRRLETVLRGVPSSVGGI